MPDKIAKLLSRIPAKDRLRMNLVLKKIRTQDFSGLDIKVSRTYKNRYRVRIGQYRVIFDLSKSQVILKSISKRSEKSYRNF